MKYLNNQFLSSFGAMKIPKISRNNPISKSEERVTAWIFRHELKNIMAERKHFKGEGLI